MLRQTILFPGEILHVHRCRIIWRQEINLQRSLTVAPPISIGSNSKSRITHNLQSMLYRGEITSAGSFTVSLEGSGGAWGSSRREEDAIVQPKRHLEGRPPNEPTIFFSPFGSFTLLFVALIGRNRNLQGWDGLRLLFFSGYLPKIIHCGCTFAAEAKKVSKSFESVTEIAFQEKKWRALEEKAKVVICQPTCFNKRILCNWYGVLL